MADDPGWKMNPGSLACPKTASIVRAFTFELGSNYISQFSTDSDNNKMHVSDIITLHRLKPLFWYTDNHNDDVRTLSFFFPFKDPFHLILTHHLIMWHIWHFQLLKAFIAPLFSFPEVLHYCLRFLNIRGQDPAMAHRCPSTQPCPPVPFTQAWFNELRVPLWGGRYFRSDIHSVKNYPIPFNWTTAWLHVQLSKRCQNISQGGQRVGERKNKKETEKKGCVRGCVVFYLRSVCSW